MLDCFSKSKCNVILPFLAYGLINLIIQSTSKFNYTVLFFYCLFDKKKVSNKKILSSRSNLISQAFTNPAFTNPAFTGQGPSKVRDNVLDLPSTDSHGRDYSSSDNPSFRHNSTLRTCRISEFQRRIPPFSIFSP